ncbi:MAG: hypothetical protein IKE53_01050 [Clostridiales bacterium]|nr:hypothetical protein [Clostridiales bacterium]
MKITPERNYRKPLYAVGIAAAAMAIAITGCSDEPPALAGDVAVTVQETTEVQLEGEQEPPVTCETKETKETEEVVELDGDVAFVEPEESK